MHSPVCFNICSMAAKLTTRLHRQHRTRRWDRTETWVQKVLAKCVCGTNSNPNACGGVRLPLGAHPFLLKLALALNVGLVHLVGVGV